MASDADDPRAPELIAAHRVLARTAFDDALSKMAESETGDAITVADRDVAIANATEYRVVVNLQALGVVHVGIDFVKDGYTVLEYNGVGAGGIVAAGAYWGTAWLNYDPNTIRGWQATFNANVFHAALNINLLGLKSEFIGPIAAGGPGLGAGISAGSGYFK